MLMNLQLKQYQDEKVEELKNKINELLELDGSKLCIFEAPTGSGKTIMVGEFLKRLVNPLDREDSKQFSFIWISVRDLHNQSKKSLGIILRMFFVIRLLKICKTISSAKMKFYF